ncbi:hypothetical protein LTS10_010226 [Elasticomyces elasticus]|nr:hypothetical protein LTS10_010226 [Elasticomyces elasticus]
MAPVLAVLLSTLVAGSAALPTTRGSPARQRYGPVPATRDYLCFDGTDATADATQWIPFDQLWLLNEPTILSKNGGDTYITHYIREAIEQVSCDGEVDASLVLAIVMQEIVYDHMFEQIVAPHEVSTDVYRAAPDNWPPSANEWWSTYSSLARSSKQIHKEMTHRFENIFLPRLSLHYSNIPDLRRYRKAIQQAPPAFADIPFTIHTTITALVDTNVLIGHKHQVTELARLYSRLDLSITELLHDFRKEHDEQNEDNSDSDSENGSESESESSSEVAKAFVVADEWSKCERCEIDLHAVRRSAEDKLTHFYHLPTRGNMQVVVVDQPIGGKTDPSSQYLELRGRVGDLELDALDKICPKILMEEERAIRGSRSKRLQRRNERKD